MQVSIRKFEKTDIEKKVEWINNPLNNQFLHYDLPLTIEKTEKWFDSHLGDTSRYDGVIEVDKIPVGTIGLLNINRSAKKAEFYIAMGESKFIGKGIAREATKKIIQYGFTELDLNRIYLYTETGNTRAQKLFEATGFLKEGLIRQDIMSHGSFADRYIYAILREDWENNQ